MSVINSIVYYLVNIYKTYFFRGYMKCIDQTNAVFAFKNVNIWSYANNISFPRCGNISTNITYISFFIVNQGDADLYYLVEIIYKGKIV